jgi:hypothetical protein
VSTPSRSSFVAVIAVLASTFCGTTTAHAQGVEITPFGGYRFGGDFFELITDQPVDLDGSVSFGAIIDIPLQRSDGFQIEGLFSHQQADLTLQPTQHGPVTLARAASTIGSAACKKFGGDRVRPFSPVLGLTRYAGGGDGRIRFHSGAGGGVKLFPTRHIGSDSTAGSTRRSWKRTSAFCAPPSQAPASSFIPTSSGGRRNRGRRLQVLTTPSAVAYEFEAASPGAIVCSASSLLPF